MAGSMLASTAAIDGLVEKKEKENEEKDLNASKMGHVTITKFYYS